MKNNGVKRFSSFIWTLVVKKENGKRESKGEEQTNPPHPNMAMARGPSIVVP